MLRRAGCLRGRCLGAIPAVGSIAETQRLLLRARARDIRLEDQFERRFGSGPLLAPHGCIGRGRRSRGAVAVALGLRLDRLRPRRFLPPPPPPPAVAPRPPPPPPPPRP